MGSEVPRKRGLTSYLLTGGGGCPWAVMTKTVAMFKHFTSNYFAGRIQPRLQGTGGAGSGQRNRKRTGPAGVMELVASVVAACKTQPTPK